MSVTGYESELLAASERTGAPYPELLCLARSVSMGSTFVVDAEAREYVVSSSGRDDRRWPFGWLVGDGWGTYGPGRDGSDANDGGGAIDGARRTG